MKKIHPLKVAQGIKTLIHLTCNRNNKIQNKFRRLYTIVMLRPCCNAKAYGSIYEVIWVSDEDNNNISHPNYSHWSAWFCTLWKTGQRLVPMMISVIFKINTDGTGYQKLLDFNNTNGASPQGSLTLVGRFALWNDITMVALELVSSLN